MKALVLSLVDVTGQTCSEHLLRAIGAVFIAAAEAWSLAELMESAVDEVQRLTDCEAVGIRLLESDGRIPYSAYTGFSREFYELESPLSVHDDRCLCINVVRGETDPALPFYTPAGSFIMNTITKFLATVSEEKKGVTRNACNRAGYESVALIPILDHGRIIGLVHLADRREWRVPPPLVEQVEQFGIALGEAIRRTQVEVGLLEHREKLAALFDLMPVGLSILDRDRRVILSNPALSRILRLPSEAIRAGGHQHRRYVRPDGSPFDPEEMPSVMADGEQLAQVFANQVQNAIKYRHPNRPPAIRITAEPDGGQWRFAVADNGIGIEEVYFERVFEVFRRLHTKDAYPGTGIGLAIVRKVVERHGGTVEIESTPGEGSTFRFTLKAA